MSFLISLSHPLLSYACTETGDRPRWLAAAAGYSLTVASTFLPTLTPTHRLQYVRELHGSEAVFPSPFCQSISLAVSLCFAVLKIPFPTHMSLEWGRTPSLNFSRHILSVYRRDSALIADKISTSYLSFDLTCREANFPSHTKLSQAFSPSTPTPVHHLPLLVSTGDIDIYRLDSTVFNHCIFTHKISAPIVLITILFTDGSTASVTPS